MTFHVDNERRPDDPGERGRTEDGREMFRNRTERRKNKASEAMKAGAELYQSARNRRAAYDDI